MLDQNDVKNFRVVTEEWLELNHADWQKRWSRVTENIKQLYEHMDWEEPEIIPCRGPMAQLMYPSLVDILLKRGSDRAVDLNPSSTTIIEASTVKKVWQDLFAEPLKYIKWYPSEP